MINLSWLKRGCMKTIKYSMHINICNWGVYQDLLGFFRNKEPDQPRGFEILQNLFKQTEYSFIYGQAQNVGNKVF